MADSPTADPKEGASATAAIAIRSAVSAVQSWPRLSPSGTAPRNAAVHGTPRRRAAAAIAAIVASTRATARKAIGRRLLRTSSKANRNAEG